MHKVNYLPHILYTWAFEVICQSRISFPIKIGFNLCSTTKWFEFATKSGRKSSGV